MFNDPFDVPLEFLFGVTPIEINKAMKRRLTALIENPPEDISDLDPKLRVILEIVKKGIPPEIKAKIRVGLKETAAQHTLSGESMDDLRKQWRTWMPELRILCLTESPSHLAMWFHYADQYKGIVLEFRCIDELDSAFLIAQPVTYPEEKPQVYSADGWAELLSLQIDVALNRIFEISTHTKAPDWSYESEWRIVSFKRPTDDGLFTDYKFDARELAGIYLGPMIADEDRSGLLSLAAEYPEIRIYEVSLGMSRELLFKEVHC